MATTTTRLGLRKPAGSDTVSVTTDLDNNYDKIDSSIGATPCTASTRPSTPFQGQLIYETDTKRLLAHNGSSPASAGWEQKAFGSFPCTASTRPSAPFQGLEIYETDTGNNLVYTGSNWQHQSIPSVSSTASILAPYSGMLIYNTTDGLHYRYDGGTSAWVKATAYARYARTSGTQAITTGTLLQWPTAITTDPRVVAGGTNNSQFTLTPGRWHISASIRTDANVTMGLYLMTGTAYNEGNAFKGNSTNSFVLCAVADTVEFTSSTTVCVGVYAASNVNAQSQGLSTQGVTSVSFTREL